MRALIVIASITLCSVRAEATYSIAAVDTVTGEVGGAGTSCVGNFSVSVIYGAVPGAGVVHAQAYFNRDARDRAVELLGQSATPADIIAEITSQAFDPLSENRQYGVATIDGATAAFTGDGCDPWAGHRTGTIDQFAYSAQGNILTSENVVLNTSAAFEASGCDLAERLMLALEAGAMNAEGDGRCTPDGIPSDGAFIRVDRPNDPGWLDLRADNTAPMNPLVLLRMEFDQWRQTHPCPASPTPDAGVPDVGPPDTSATEDATLPADAAPSPDAAPAKDAGPDASQLADAGASDGDDQGCGCTASPRPASPILLLLLFVLSRRARRDSSP